jgi:3-deoxy-D-manno-octulosonate 8-phosphate phosphatase (KDO 8-P phosphatase)
VSRRARELAIAHVAQGVGDKVAAFERLRGELGLAREACAFMGDDLPDLGVMRLCGLAAAPDNAAEGVKAAAHFVTRARGGGGAVREFCELVLRSQGLLETPELG